MCNHPIRTTSVQHNLIQLTGHETKMCTITYASC